MTSLISNYNRCQGDFRSRFVSQKPKTAVSLAVFGGVHADQLHAEDIPSSAISQSVSPYGGARIEISSPRVYDRISLSLEVLYMKKKYHANFAEIFVSESSYYEYTINTSMVKVPLGFKYSFFEDHNTPYIRFGYVHTFSSDADAKITTDRVLQNSSVYTTKKEKTYPSRKSQGGYWAAVGYTYQVRKPFSLFVEFRGERTGGAIDSNFIGFSHHVSFYFTTGIRF